MMNSMGEETYDNPQLYEEQQQQQQQELHYGQETYDQEEQQYLPHYDINHDYPEDISALAPEEEPYSVLNERKSKLYQRV